jgi:hypothetical protein
MNYKKIDWARKILDLLDEATMDEIKAAYKEKAKECHPDKNGSDEKMKEINEAYRLILQYCADYKFSFKEEDVKRINLNEERFYYNWF